MKLCEEQKAFIILVILVAIGIVAFVSGFFDLGGLISNLISDGVITCLGYLFLKQRATNIEKAKMIDAKKTFLEWFHFFPNKWSSLKELIKSGSIREPEINQPNTFADQIISSFEGVQAVGFKFHPRTKGKIKKIIEDLHRFGFDLRVRMRTLGGSPLDVNEAMKEFVERGEKIVNEIEKVSKDVEEALEIT